ncbi:MAG: rod-binding protein [Myxococcota bacterium]|jgi:Rod binding domain-containing protein|nr:rod-binding protein [Myxococcota bacterium]
MISSPRVDGALLLRNANLARTPDAEKATREFDAYFLSQFLKSAGGATEEHLLDGGSAGRMYRDQFMDEIARVLAEHGGVGISQQLADEVEPSKEEEEGA